MNFKSELQENENYKKLYDFINTSYAKGEILEYMNVWRRYFYSTHDKLNGEFDIHYEKVIQTLLSDGKIRRFPGKEEYIINYEETINQDDKDKSK